MIRGFPIALLLVLGLTDCTMPLSCGAHAAATPSSDDTSLDGRLVRCSALGAKAHDDPECEGAFEEARKRILPLPAEK